MRSIIHFTDKFDKLKNILAESSFRLKYCREAFYLEEDIASNAVHPMVSFSERNVKTIDKGTITYGKYGIAFKRRWVRENKIHPVMYMGKDSHLAKALSILLRARRKDANSRLEPEVRLSIITIKCFTKNARGYNSFLKRVDFNFREEREWRYVPEKTAIGGNLISQNRSAYNKRKDFYNNKLTKFPLKFDLADIAYIFVETDDQRQQIARKFFIDKDIIKISRWKTDLKDPKQGRKTASKAK